MVTRTSDLDPFERGKSEPAGPATYEPAEPVTSFGNQGYRMMEPARLVTKPVEPRNFRPASYLNVEVSMSTSEPWRLEPAQPVKHASYHSVSGSERSQPIRSRPAQPATCSSAQGPRRVESGRHIIYPTWSHMELVRENEPARPVTWPNTQDAGSVKPAGPVHWSGIEVSQPTRCEPERSMTYMNEKKSIGSDTLRSLTLPWNGRPPTHEPAVNMTLLSEQEARRTKPVDFETCHDEQIPGRNRSLQYIDAHLAQRVT